MENIYRKKAYLILLKPLTGYGTLNLVSNGKKCQWLSLLSTALFYQWLAGPRISHTDTVCSYTTVGKVVYLCEEKGEEDGWYVNQDPRQLLHLGGHQEPSSITVLEQQPHRFGSQMPAGL